MYRLGLVYMLVTNANTKGFGLTSLSGVCRGSMPPQLKTKQDFIASQHPGVTFAEAHMLFMNSFPPKKLFTSFWPVDRC